MAGTLVLFDFDGTITRSDTLFLFTKSAVSPVKYWLGLIVLSPVLVLHKLGLIGSQKTKEIFLGFYFGGTDLGAFNSYGKKFKTIIDADVRPKAAEQIAEYKRQGHRVIVVSASAVNWLGTWAASHHLELICTKLEVVNGKITGKLDGENCNGAEKVNRIKSYLNLSDYGKVIVYGDSKGDREMFTLGTETHFKPFRD